MFSNETTTRFFAAAFSLMVTTGVVATAYAMIPASPIA